MEKHHSQDFTQKINKICVTSVKTAKDTNFYKIEKKISKNLGKNPTCAMSKEHSNLTYMCNVETAKGTTT